MKTHAIIGGRVAYGEGPGDGNAHFEQQDSSCFHGASRHCKTPRQTTAAETAAATKVVARRSAVAGVVWSVAGAATARSAAPATLPVTRAK